MIAKLTYKNQLTLPKEIVTFFGKIEYFDVERTGETITLRPVDIKPKGASLKAAREKIKKLGLTEAEVATAVKWARTRRGAH